MIDSIFSKRSMVEPLEARIAPALTGVASAHWVTATLGAPIPLHAGDGLSTAGANAGSYLLYLEKGDALVFVTDLNNNGDVDFNEITGIAAGDGTRLISFVDIHGDIATNLLKTTATISGVPTTVLSLSDSDNNRTNDPTRVGDGRVLLNNSIEKIELRSLTVDDFSVDQNADGAIDAVDVALRKSYNTYSIFGNIYAGRSFGTTGGGLIIDSTGATGNFVAGNFGFTTDPTVGSIKTGTSASGEFFSFGSSNQDDINGTFVNFTPPRGQVGGDIIGVKAVAPSMTFNIDGLYAGDGGIGARGGNIQDVILNQDNTSGYQVIAGNGGRGPSGGVGGAVLNFSDLNSQTGKVVIQSGSGGAGSTGAGGSGGTLAFETFNVYGNVNVTLGSGGDGFTAGGNGAALAKGTFNQPDPVSPDPGNGYGTYHQATVDADADPLNGFQAIYSPAIGTHTGIDFDNDGNGDFVYTSKVTSQVAVMFGNGFGGFRTILDPDGISVRDRIYLSGLRNPEALTVGDFNGDGHADIAVGSQDSGSHAGVAVFLSKYEDGDNNGLTTNEDLNRDLADNFLGFHDVRFSNLPQLDRGDPLTSNQILPFWQGPVQISSLTSGDYDGDGKVELAAVATYYATKISDLTVGTTSSLGRDTQVLLYLTPDEEFNNNTQQFELTGQFYADFGTKQVVANGVTTPPSPRLPFVLPADDLLGRSKSLAAHTLVVETTALNTATSNHDVIIAGVKNDDAYKQAVSIDYQNRDPIQPGNFPVSAVAVGFYSFGKVDTDRDLSDAGKSDKKQLEDILLQDFTIVDLANGANVQDGRADLGVISSSPAGYLVGVVGNGTGSGTQNSGSPPFPNGVGQPGDNPNDNQGTYFGKKGIDIGTNIIAIKSMDADADGQIDDLMVLQGTGTITRLKYQPGPQPTDPVPGNLAQTTGAVELLGFSHTIGGATPAEYFTDIFLPVANNPSNPLYVVSLDASQTNALASASLTLRSNLNGRAVGTQPLLENGLKLSAGDGGDGLVGKGGIGGLLGSGSKTTAIIDPITGLSATDLAGSLTVNLSGTVRFFAGNGGNGFSTGGKGGTVSGVVLRPLPNPDQTVFFPFLPLTVTVSAGDGGVGVSGAGGAGGDISQNSIYGYGTITIPGGATFFAGDGGQGRIGGDGGDVLGNGTKVYDTQARTVLVTAGNAGNGQIKGGAGGNILNFSPIAGDTGSDARVTNLRYIAGNGGSAASGAGGNGGSIVNSSPKPGDGIQFEILVDGGDGGDGRTGGNGGNVTKFILSPSTNSKKPETISILGGAGGDGTSGNGGNGGTVSNISVPTRGVTPSPALSSFTYNRVLGGDGGVSSGAKGGNGGNVTDLTSGATAGAFAVIGGAGGNGLTVGGNGGNVLRTDLFLATSTVAKALIIAGAGGDASAFMANGNDSAPNQGNNAFGGKIGVGGKGGDIIGFTQTGSIGVHVDLIAGDGGSTINYGSAKDIKGFAGKGGSIQKVKTESDIGNLTADDPNTNAVNENVPIKSYNNILAGETIAQWVNANVRTNAAPAATLDDSDGNVGIVVGVAGRNKAVVTDPAGNPTVYTKLPSAGITNGSLIDIEARNIMSAVAGSVDRIASIQIAKNIRVLNGIVGADKGVDPMDFPALIPTQGALGQKDYLDQNGVLIDHPVRDGQLIDGAFIAQVILDASGKPGTLPGSRIFNL